MAVGAPVPPGRPGPRVSALGAILVRGALPVAMLLFLVLGVHQAETIGLTSEEVEMHPRDLPGLLVQAGDGGPLTYRSTCGSGRPIDLVLQRERPLITLCLGTRGYPVLVTPYYSGVFAWPLDLLRPLHGGDPIARRKVALGFGLLALWLMHRLVRRFAGPRAAAIGVLATAGSAFFTFVHSLQQLQETVPWTLLTAALVVLCEADLPAGGGRAPGGGLSTRRLAFGALLLGATGLANLKYLVMALPMLAVARVYGLPFTRLSAARALGAAGLVALPLAPLLVRAVLLPDLSLSQGRGGTLHEVLANLVDLQRYAQSAWFAVVSCTNSAGALLGSGWSPTNPMSALVAAAGLAYVLAAGLWGLVRRRGNPLTAMLAAYMVAMLGLVAVIYRGFPPNTVPLHGGFGFFLGLAVDRLAAATPERARPGVSLALAAVVLVSLVPGTRAILAGFSEMPLPMNPYVLAQASTYLRQHPEGGRAVTVEPLLSRVVDAMSDDAVTTLPAHGLVDRCDGEPRSPARRACRAERFRQLIAFAKEQGPFRVLLPHEPPEMFRPDWRASIRDDVASLQEGAATFGLTVAEERVFATAGGVPAIRLLRVAPARPRRTVRPERYSSRRPSLRSPR